MPPGPWKSKWEKSDERWVEVREECRDLRADYGREVAETRLFNRELLIRLEKTYANLGDALEGVGEALDHTGERIDTNTGEVKAQTQAILRLVDHFEEPNGRPPV